MIVFPYKRARIRGRELHSGDGRLRCTLVTNSPISEARRIIRDHPELFPKQTERMFDREL